MRTANSFAGERASEIARSRRQRIHTSSRHCALCVCVCVWSSISDLLGCPRRYLVCLSGDDSHDLWPPCSGQLFIFCLSIAPSGPEGTLPLTVTVLLIVAMVNWRTSYILWLQLYLSKVCVISKPSSILTNFKFIFGIWFQLKWPAAALPIVSYLVTDIFPLHPTGCSSLFGNVVFYLWFCHHLPAVCVLGQQLPQKKKRHQQFAISFAVIYLYWQRGPERMPPYRLAISSKLPYINSYLKVCLTIAHFQYSRMHSISSWSVCSCEFSLKFFSSVCSEITEVVLCTENQTGMQLNN